MTDDLQQMKIKNEIKYQLYIHLPTESDLNYLSNKLLRHCITIKRLILLLSLADRTYLSNLFEFMHRITSLRSKYYM